ncbi:MAG: permease [Candidatus Dormibacteraeota bacterium]|nr:permease [Candidatus Dormibacteraeota bacterium]MBV8445814.1 permease [Candidatus Dormibacteraeota bacterium]
MMVVVQHIADALRLAGTMFWQVLWPLLLGFLLSATIETLVPKQAVSRALGRDSVRGVTLATLFGAASSSCSYAAVAVARTLFRKGASFGNAIIFEFASTNLVFELGLVLVVLLGWQFLGAELAGGVIMVVLLALLFRATLRPSLVTAARAQAERGVQGRMEGHAAMDMSVTDGPLLRRAFSSRALTGVSHYFFMNVYSLWLDLLLGFLIAGALASWVPSSWWAALFLSGHGVWSDVWDAFIGPLVAMLSFVCSVGNVPLAATLWRAGIGFAGAIAFIFGDLVILPILDIYRRYYGVRPAAYLFVVSFAAMAAAGLAVAALFHAIGAIPASHTLAAFGAGVAWDAGTVANIVLLTVAALLGVRFLRTGGPAMLRLMG